MLDPGVLFETGNGSFLTILRVVLFSLPMYMLSSRYYRYLRLVPEELVKSRYSGKRLSTLTPFQVETVPFAAIHVTAVIACLTGILGIFPAVSALAAAFGIVILNNYYFTTSTSDAEVAPYVIGLFVFASLDPSFSIPLWSELAGQEAPPTPFYPFLLLQIYLAVVFFTNGLIKVPYWREWVVRKGTYYDADVWNTLSPYLDTWWSSARPFRRVPLVWQTLGFLTIVVEVGAVLPLFYPRTLFVIWPVTVAFFLGNHLLRSTSFLLFPWIYGACFLPTAMGVFV